MGTILARRYLGTIWSLIALGTLGNYIEITRNDGTVEGKSWGFAAAGLAIGIGLVFYERFRPAAKAAETADAPAAPVEEEKKN